MKVIYTLGIIILLLLLGGCGAYQQLKPRPDIIASESKYIKLSRGKKSFFLKKNKKYYVGFPAIKQDHFYLAIKLSDEQMIDGYLTTQLPGKVGRIVRIGDASGDPTDNALAYPLNKAALSFYWVIENVQQDMELAAEYRYVPIWRFKFETSSALYKRQLIQNTVERRIYETLGVGIGVESVDYNSEIVEVERKSANLKTLQKSLKRIEKIFPRGIRNSNDRAYLEYLSLKENLELEQQFQQNYGSILKAIKLERESRENPAAFVAAIPEFLLIVEQSRRYPANIRQTMKEMLGKRLINIAPVYEAELRKKQDIAHIEFPGSQAEDLLRRCGLSANRRFSAMTSFIEHFNRSAAAVKSADDEIGNIRKIIQRKSWPENAFYLNLKQRLNRLHASIPNIKRSFPGIYETFPCVVLLKQRRQNTRLKISQLHRNVQRASELVSRINQYKSEKNYAAIRRLLKTNSDIDFLLKQYGNIDQISLNEQGKEILTAIGSKNWADAEAKLKTLHLDQDFLNYQAIAADKNARVNRYEEKLFKAVESASQKRITEFIRQHPAAVENVEALYQDNAFQLVHPLTFSAKGASYLKQQRQKLQKYLDAYKYNKLPESSIRRIYKVFSRNPADNGIMRARAIVLHGKFYKGSDRKVKRLIAECDPWAAKWITKPKRYRKIYVLPVNAAQQRQNEYVFRLNLQISSEAQFPVFDVNIKLPREIAKSANQKQWYDKITLNKKILKNEGRFSITAPTKSNNYESQITPLQVRKRGNNILEVRFKHDAFKVLEVSIMAQRPIIKKN